MDYLVNLPTWAVALVILWSLPWKGFALWKAARLSDRNWFIVILVLNTFAILDIMYIFFVAKKREEEADADADADAETQPEPEENGRMS